MRGLKVAVLVLIVALALVVLPRGGGVVYAPPFVGAAVDGKGVSYEFGEEKISVVLLDSGEAEFNIFLNVKNTGNENVTSFSFIVELTDVSGLSVINFSAPLYNYTVEFRRYDAVIYVETLIPPGEAGNFSLSFTTGRVVLSLYGYFQFLFSEKLEVNVGRFVFEVWLPAGCFLYTKSVEPVYPEPTNNFTDGERLCFQWEYENLPPGTAMIFVIYYSDGERQSSSVLVLPFPVYLPPSISQIGLASVAAVSAATAMFIYLRRRREKLREAANTILLLLTDSEREILKLLSASEDGTMTQKEIQEATGYSKAKVSVTISLLEKKGLVEKEAKGRTKIVKLKKKIKI